MATETLTPADRIQKTFDELDAEKALIDTCTLQWKSITDHFASLAKALADASDAMDSKIQALESQTKETIASLDLRQATIPDRESAAAASIESKKELAIKEMVDAEAKSSLTKGEFLRLYCRRMDSSNLWRFMISHRKDLAVLRKEIAEAIVESVDACRLVIDAVDDFLKQGESVESGGSDRCWAIGMLLRALFDSEGRKGPEVSAKIRERAVEVAAEWKKRIGRKGGEKEGEDEGDKQGEEMGGAEAQIFLQMVVAFGLNSRFEVEELMKMVLEHASRKEMAKLAAGLGFGEKMADIIDELVKTEKELEAVCFACEAGLTEKFPPAPLLKNCFTNSKKKAQTIAKNGNNSAAAIEESSNMEMNAIRSIIKCVEYYKLESMFSVDGPKKRLTALEKAKAERKKTAAATKSQTKRARATGGSASSFRPLKSGRTAGAPYASSFQPYNQLPPRYSYPVQGSVYDGSVPSAYGVARSRSPFYSGASANYSGYDYAAPHVAPAQPQYPH